MIREGDQLALRVETRLEVMEPAGTIELMLQVLVAIPQQLHRLALQFGYHRRLDHEIAAQAPSKTATAAGHVHRDSVLGYAEGLGDQGTARTGILRRRPDLKLAVLEGRRG